MALIFLPTFQPSRNINGQACFIYLVSLGQQYRVRTTTRIGASFGRIKVPMCGLSLLLGASGIIDQSTTLSSLIEEILMPLPPSVLRL